MIDFDRGYFSLHSESAGKVKSVSATANRGTFLVKMEVQFSSAVEMAYALEALNLLQASHRVSKRRSAPRLLALPAPESQT